MWFFLFVMLAVSSFVDSSAIDSSLSSAANPSRHKRDEIWWNPTLPNTIVPTLYILTISPRFYFTDDNFIGHVAIELNVLIRTNTIIVHMKGLNMNRFKIYSKGKLVKRTSHFQHYKNDYWVFDSSAPLLGKARLEVFFEGKIPTVTDRLYYDLPGIFKIPYLNTATGKQSWLLVTDFRPSNARMVFPCFDEPRYKAPFTIRIQHWSRFEVLSNMPIDSIVDQSPHMRITTFKVSLEMSSYHVAFAVTDFRCNNRTFEGKQYRFWTRQGNVAKTEYALNVTQAIQHYFHNEITGVPEPLEKIDLLAVPGQHWEDQRENWGLSTYNETTVLINAWKDGYTAKFEALKLVANALAHNYFGNLVTCRLWDHVWLNEGLSKFYEILAVTKVDPSYYYKEFIYGRELDVQMNSDASESFGDALVQKPYHGQLNVIPSFDATRRIKGAAIIRMLENGIVRDGFFKLGIWYYLVRHQFGTVTTADFMDSMQQANGNDPVVHVWNVMYNWTYKKGIPIVKIEMHAGGVVATQRQFLLDPYAEPAYKIEWPIMLSYRRKNGESGLHWLNQSSVNLTLPGHSMDDWFVCNYDRVGYYRVDYDANLWGLLAKQLNENHTVFTELTRSMLISDALAVRKTWKIDYTIFLALIRYAKDERDLTPWLHIYDGFLEINKLMSMISYRPFQAYILKRVSQLMGKLQVKDEGTYIERQLRPIIMTMACSTGHRGCIDGATRAFKAWIRDEHTTAIPENCRSQVYCYGLAYSILESEWNTTFERCKRATSKEERTMLFETLACSRNVTLLERLLAYAVSNRSGYEHDADNSVFDIFSYVAKNPWSDKTAWKWLKNNYKQINAATHNEYFVGFILPHAVEYLTTRPQLEEVRKFFDDYTDIGEDERQLAQEHIRGNIAWMDRYSDTIKDWFKKYVLE